MNKSQFKVNLEFIMSFMRPALIVSAFFLLVSGQRAIGQRSSFSAPALLSQSLYTQWTGDNGLVSNNITSAIRDRSGFVWVTSYNGIMRFDGIQVYVYDESKIPFLTTGAFYAVHEDKAGTLWFASQSSGVVRYRDGKFEKIDFENKVLPNSIRSLKISDDGTIWVGANYSGLYKIKDNKFERIDCPDLNETSILEMDIDAQGNLWLATDNRGLYKYDGIKFEKIKGVSGEIVNSVCVANDNSILIGTQFGLDIYEDGRLRRHPNLKDFQVNKIICDRNDRVWIGSELGLGRFDLADEENYSYISEKEGFPLARINFLHFDEENSLWVSTGRDGLVQLRESNIVNITSQQGLSVNKINVISEGADKTFYIGSDGGSIDMYKYGQVAPLKINTPIHESGIRDIYVDKDVIWIASYRGLLQKTKTGEKLYDTKDGLTAIDLRRILPDGQGNLWLGTRSGGVMKFRDGKVVEKYVKGQGLETSYALALEKDKNGNLYVGTHSGGMTVIHPDGKTETFHIEKSDEGILIFNIHIDREGKIWAVGNRGLLRFDGQKFHRINLMKLLKGEIFFDWVEDNAGNVWITGNLGILKILKSDILKYVNNEISEVKFKLFDDRDGMKGKECTSATRALLSSSGRVWVPTIKGISVFYPEKSVENKVPPPVYITSLLADDEELDPGKDIVIAPGKLRYTFLFTAPSFVSPRKIQFKYKLETVDENWINAGTTRQAEYTNLSPGEYTFKVLACNNDGVWNEKGAALTFAVKPFFYQTTGFYFVSGALLLLFMFGIYKWRINAVERRNLELRKVNGELDRFVYSASHDLRAPLASILGLVNVARMEQGRDFISYLDKIETSVQKLDGFIKDIIDFSRNARLDVESEIIDFNALITDIFDNLRYLDEKDRIKRTIKVEGSGNFYSDKKRLLVVLNNLIGNAIKYSNPYEEHPFIEVYVKQNPKQVLLHVKDNGIGIGHEHIASIFKMFYRADSKSKGSGIGLYIVKETLDKIQGSISVMSEYGKGSTFIVLLKALSPKPINQLEKTGQKIEGRNLNLTAQTKSEKA